MIKDYKTSNLIRLFTLGLKRIGIRIDKVNLVVTGLISEKVIIDSIDTISYGLRTAGKGMSYFYILTDNRGREFMLSRSLLDGKTYQELFRDLLQINPKIKLTSEIRNFIDSEVKEIDLKFDFNVYKGEFLKRDRELSQKHPTLDAFIGLTIVFVIMPIPFVFGIVGNNILIENISDDYEIYRIWAIVISGISFSITLTNLFISLVSMYLGHRLTILTLTITLIGLYIGLNI